MERRLVYTTKYSKVCPNASASTVSSTWSLRSNPEYLCLYEINYSAYSADLYSFSLKYNRNWY
jgi:hypothetical protein